MIRRLLIRVMKVPPEPHVPPGAELVQIFRAALNFFRLQQIKWAVGQFLALIGLVISAFVVHMVGRTDPRLRDMLLFLEVLGILTFLAQIPITWLILRLDYEMRWYIVTDRSLRIREGVWKVREKTMTYANIQNMTIRQGPLQRILRIADLEVRTAGGGAHKTDQHQQMRPQDDMHRGFFRGVDNAAEIRDLIRVRVPQHRDSGLGDPDEVLPAIAPDALAAAREVLDEVRALRSSISFV